MNSPLLTNFSILRPEHEATQEKLLEWVGAAHTKVLEFSGRSEDAEKLRAKLGALGLGPGKIQRRASAFGDCLHQNWEEMEIYRISESSPEGFHLDKRMHLFDRVTSDVFERFFPNDNPLSPHLIHVSCTGYVSPSGAQKIVSRRQADTIVTHAYHMGCYGSIPALRMALGHWHVENSASDIVHTELCSLHMNPNLHTTDQLVVQSLFGDGFIKYSLKPADRGFRIEAVHELVIPKSTDQMVWQCHQWGFYMVLAKEVPVSIARALAGFIEQLFKKSKKSIKEKVYYAIHPGGPKIIEQVAKLLHLSESQVRHSTSVLSEYGNMSSATLPHIWQRMLDDPEIPKGAQIVSLAFGPGLSIAGALFEKA